MNEKQKLFWAMSMPLKWLGLTIDEWFIIFSGFIPGIVLINSSKVKYGIISITISTILCISFKKYKNLSNYFLFKSWLLSKGLIPPPSKNYPNMLHKMVGK